MYDFKKAPTLHIYLIFTFCMSCHLPESSCLITFWIGQIPLQGMTYSKYEILWKLPILNEFKKSSAKCYLLELAPFEFTNSTDPHIYA